MIIEQLPNKEMVHRVMRFEIKRRCMLHPHDILGAQLCKKIESVCQDVVDGKEKRPKVSSDHQWCNKICICMVSTKDKIISFVEKMPFESKNCCHWIIILMVLSIIAPAIVSLARYFDMNIWMEVGLLIVLMAITVATVLVLKDRPFYSKYTLWSVIQGVAKVVFFSGLGAGIAPDICAHLSAYIKRANRGRAPKVQESWPKKLHFSVTQNQPSGDSKKANYETFPEPS